MHDFSAFHPVEIGADGRFGYQSLPLYWSEPGRYPFLVRIDRRWAGLALVKKGSAVLDDDTVWDMAEFFVLRGCRRRGIGTEIAHQVWQRFPGPWQVRVMESNLSVLGFWTHAISTFTREAAQPVRIEKGTRCWHVFSFESRLVT